MNPRPSPTEAIMQNHLDIPHLYTPLKRAKKAGPCTCPETGADCWLRDHDLSDPAVYMVPLVPEEGRTS